MASIERALAPQGCKITVNERIFGDEGDQIAEFDIVIEFPGSPPSKWLIECRDRPSQGAAPGSWLEQLYGRRARFGFQSVFAVSTTGFAPETMRYAAEVGIPLRTVHDIEELETDFRIREHKLRNLWVDPTGPLVLPGLRKPEGPSPTSDAIELRCGELSAWLKFREFIAEHLRARGLHFVPGAGTELYVHESPVEVRSGEGVLGVATSMSMPISWQSEIYDAVAVEASLYSERTENIGALAIARWDTNEGPVSAQFILATGADGRPVLKGFQPIQVAPTMFAGHGSVYEVEG